MQNGVRNFKDLHVWQRSHQLSISIYKMTEGMNDFAFKNQIRRASVSVGANISEGFHRYNPKEFKYFLRISRGSINEVQNFLILGKDLGYFDSALNYEKECIIISKMILQLIKSLE